MAGFLDRWRALRAAVEPGPDAAEDPREALDQAYQHQLELLQRVRRELAGVDTSLRRIDVVADRLARQLDTLAGTAEQSLADGLDEDARVVLSHRTELADQLADLRTQRATLAGDHDTLSALAQEFQARIQAFRARRDAIAARFVAERARIRIDPGSGSGDWSGRADLAEALAYSSRVESELDRLRAELLAARWPAAGEDQAPQSYEQPPTSPAGPPDPLLR